MITQKYRNDFSRCVGENCLHRHKCTRYFAHLESSDLKLERVVYTEPKECIEKYYYLLALEER